MRRIWEKRETDRQSCGQKNRRHFLRICKRKVTKLLVLRLRFGSGDGFADAGECGVVVELCGAIFYANA